MFFFKTPEKWGSPDMLNILKYSSFEQVGSRDRVPTGIQPYFFKAKDVIIFPPVSDDNHSQNLESIESSIKKAADHYKGELNGKKMLFPLVEEQYRWLWPRNHWVTLFYDPITNPARPKATLIDSRASWFSYGYNYNPMQALLTAGLRHLDLEVAEFEYQYQNVQQETKHCGDWTAINIESLAAGLSLEDLLTFLSVDDALPIIDHNNIKREQGINPGIYLEKMAKVELGEIAKLRV